MPEQAVRVPPREYAIVSRSATIAALGVLLMSTAAAAGRPVALCTVCLLNGPAYESRDYVLAELAKAPAGLDLICLPHLPFLSFRGSSASRDLAPFVAFAKERACYLAFSLLEHSEGKVYATAVLLDRKGRIAGRYRKTHAFPDDRRAGLALGDSLPVFKTDFGKVGLTVTTDFYFLEVYQVLSLSGADVITWHDYPERLRDYSGHEPLLMARCLDAHAHLVAATYADPRTYITNGWDMGMPGAAWGRSMVLNRVGVPVADTGYEDGVAVARLDLGKRKQNVYQPSYQGENIFFVNNYGDRKAFAPLAEPWRKPRLPAYSKRTCRLVVGWLPRADSWVKEKLPERVLALLRKAEPLHPDLVLLSEMSTNSEDPTTARAMAQVGEIARTLHSYVAIGGIGDKDQLSLLRLWDREGKEVYKQALYWVKGYPKLAVFDTDFGRVASHECGDLYIPEFDRTLALLGAELIVDASQMWGASGRTNETMLRARALDNGVWLACAHWPTSDPSLRSLIIDPYGQVMASSTFEEEGLIAYDVNLDRGRGYYAGEKKVQVQPGDSGIPSYFSNDLPDQLGGWREMLLAARRPELYGVLPATNEVTARYRGTTAP